MNNEQHLSNLNELARRLKRFGISASWLRQEAEAGRIPSLRAGKRLLFNVAAVEHALLRRAAQGVDAVEHLLLDRARKEKGGPVRG